MAWTEVTRASKVGSPDLDGYGYPYTYSYNHAATIRYYIEESVRTFHVGMSWQYHETNFSGGTLLQIPASSLNLGSYRYRIRTLLNNVQIAEYEITSIPSTSQPSLYSKPYSVSPKANDVYVAILEREVRNTAPTTPGVFTSPASGTVLKGGQIATFSFGASTDAEGNSISYYPEYRYYKNGVAQAWNSLSGSTARSRDLTLTTDKTMNKIEFRVRAYDGQAYSAYRQSATYDIIHNTAPTFNLSTVDNQVLFTNGVLTISGSASDADVGNAISVKYQIDNGTVRTAFTTKTTDTNPIPFSTDLTLIDGKMTENGVPVTDALAEEVTYMLKVWVEDDQGGKSSILTRNFQVILNKKPVITVISSVYPDFIWEVSDEDGTIVRSSFIVNDNELMRIPHPTEQLKYTLTPGKLVFGSNLVLIEAEDDLGAVTQRKFNVTMERVRIPETQLKANLSAETVKEVLLTMKREDAAENIKITRIVGGIG